MGAIAPALLKKAASSDPHSLNVDEKSGSDGALSIIDAEKSINGGA